MSDTANSKLLRYVHIGDLHITERGLQNHIDLRRIVDEINANAGGDIDFVVLPGDIADDGTSEQFGIVYDEISRLIVPWSAIPGDHDFKSGLLDSFYDILNARWLPYVAKVGCCRCIFLDAVSHGAGGLDFRLGKEQMNWLRDYLDIARREKEPVVVFMHTYPADFRDEADELAKMFDESTVVLVDMGHTHYNELANDGRTIYATTRSVGQIEEGDVGFAFVAVDRGAVSWRFKTLDSPWPFVMITSPSDRRLVIDPDATRLTAGQRCEVRASVWGKSPIANAVLRIDDGGWHAMHAAGEGLFIAEISAPDRSFRLSVRARDRGGKENVDSIEVAPPDENYRKPTGSDAGGIGAWPERHLLGTQLGPNRNGRKW
jgi:Icc protein